MMSERSINSYTVCWNHEEYGDINRMTCLPIISAFLAHFGQKLQTGHPFFSAQTRFACEGMNMGNKSFQNISKSDVVTLGVGPNCMLRDIV